MTRLIPIFLQLGPEFDAVRLPGFDSRSLPYLVYFLLAVIGGLLFLQWRLRRRAEKNALANRFMQIMLQRNLTKRQYRAVDTFFHSLKESQQNEILLSPKALAHYLHEYLNRETTLPASDRVEIFDKILPGMIAQIEIKGVGDLRAGELCAIDVAGTSHLANVIKTKNNQVLVSTNDKATLPIGAARLYAYRPKLGGFLLDGKITKASSISAIFEHTGAIEFRGDQHLMAIVQLPLKLERWPKEDLEITEKDEATDEVKEPECYYAMTEKISDRALSIKFHETPTPSLLRRQEYWEMTLELPDEPLICRVRVTNYKPPLFLVRPVDLDAALRQRLYKFIAQNKPVREHF